MEVQKIIKKRSVKMNKAILELPKMPNSCMECPLYKITGICDILSAWNNFMPVYVPNEGRHPDCPLKEVKENKVKECIK